MVIRAIRYGQENSAHLQEYKRHHQQVGSLHRMIEVECSKSSDKQ